MKLKIIAVGRIKEEYLRSAIDYYSKRVKRKGQFEIIEVADERAPENYSLIEIERVKRREGEKIAAHIQESSYVTALDILGKSYTTSEFKIEMKKINDLSYNEIVFIIGGSNGLSSQVLKRANKKVSFSPMTFPHQLMRVILVDQLDRIL